MKPHTIDIELHAALQGATAEELALIAACLKRKFTERFSHSQAYRDYHEAEDKEPYREAYVQALSHALCLMGGHMVANCWRGWQGVSYRRMMDRQARRLRLRYPKATPLETLERAVLATELSRAWRRLRKGSRDRWMTRQLLDWAQDEQVPIHLLARLKSYFDAQPQQLAVDDMLGYFEQFCQRELPDGERLYQCLIARAFAAIHVILDPKGLRLKLLRRAHAPRPHGVECAYTLCELLGHRLPHTINRPRLITLFRLWLRAPASPIPSSSSDPNSGLGRVLLKLLYLQPNSLTSSLAVLPLLPMLAAATAGTAVFLATRPADRVIRPLLLMIICSKQAQLRS